jgi:hypothetical protein
MPPMGGFFYLMKEELSILLCFRAKALYGYFTIRETA